MIGPIPRLVAKLVLRAVWWLMIQPVIIGIGLGRLHAAKPYLQADVLICGTCGAENALLGSWQCHCGFAWYGHYWVECTSCRSLPPFFDCERCGASTQHPAIFG